ncbi:hypothetical protein HFO74_19120 [Rhizobium laguerreae]|uniref:Uncharacterized protein n=1 Tax=Rhizobium laguerreae TaxID=1076926 RepID=A0AB35FFI4_9HYPH|nr:hypothetical protein [Rhizobium laguerreae]MBY3065506.1 hypothetical protein [Rhizobium laguerreae]MBY3111659.1 hypothetical protein [Rhizobium laguerreae]MBY3142043.1 hypothetical protein [Rhizobium laguerreae]MBY3303241.1 hypothetical protein [Rhizobium laguerreae]MBY3413017.1 hypothetical protein [Rhizobium laguerreae]
MRIVSLSASLALTLTPAAAYADTTQGNADMFKTLLSKIGLRSEAQPISATPHETLAQLRDAVAARLRSEPEVEEVAIDPGNPAALRVRLANGGGEAVMGTVDVTNVYGRLYTLRNDLDREAAIENLVQSVLVTVRRPELDLQHVFANIRFRQPGNKQDAATSLAEELAGDVAIVLQLDTPQSLVGLSRADLGECSVAEIRKAAQRNILREMSKLGEERVNDHMIAYRIEDNPPLTPAIVLTDEFWAMVDKNFPDGALLILRQRDEVAVIDRKAPSALITAWQLIDMAKHRGVDFLSDRIFERRDGRLVAVTE